MSLYHPKPVVRTYSVGASLCITLSLLCEQIVLAQVFVSICTNTICSHKRLGVIHRLVPTLYVHTTGLGWYTDVYQQYMFTQQAWGDTKSCTNTICSQHRLGVIQRLVPTLYAHTTGLGWYKDLYQHYMFTQQAEAPKPVVWTYSVGTSPCITPSLLCEHIVLVQVWVSPQACCVNI
jgi:hypothetical protein